MRALLPRLRVSLLGCLLVAAVPVAAHAQPKVNKNPIEAPEIKRLELRGVKNVDPIDLERSIASVATTCRSVLYTPFCKIFGGRFVRKEYLDRGEIAADMLRIRVYYWKRGFRSTDVDTIITKVGDNKVDVVFDIAEHEPTIVRRIQIDYDSVLLRQKRIQKLTLLKAGQPLDLVRLDSMRISFAQEMWGEGHSDATVDTVVTVD